jgi:hypothetical protein
MNRETGPSRPELAVARQGERQRGLVTRRQALRAGLSKAQVDRLVAGGKWKVLFPCVYGLPGAPRCWEQSLMGACLWGDAVASHRSAAALWSLEGFAPGEIRRLLHPSEAHQQR